MGPNEPKTPLGDLHSTYNSSSVSRYYGKMADLDINLFREHDKTNAHSDEIGNLTPGGGVGGGSTWEPEREQETLFGGMSLRTEVLREHVEALYQTLFESMGQTSESFHFDDFELRERELYYKGKVRPLTIRGGKLRPVGTIADILGKERLRELGFDIPRG